MDLSLPSSQADQFADAEGLVSDPCCALGSGHGRRSRVRGGRLSPGCNHFPRESRPLSTMCNSPKLQISCFDPSPEYPLDGTCIPRHVATQRPRGWGWISNIIPDCSFPLDVSDILMTKSLCHPSPAEYGKCFSGGLKRFTAICVLIDRILQNTAPICCLPFDGIGARHPGVTCVIRIWFGSTPSHFTLPATPRIARRRATSDLVGRIYFSTILIHPPSKCRCLRHPPRSW